MQITPNLMIAVLLMTVCLAGLVAFRIMNGFWRNLVFAVAMLCLLTGAFVTVSQPAPATEHRAAAPP